jgi:3'-5' exoribonuclease
MANAAKILTMSTNSCTEGTFIVSDVSLNPFRDPTKGNYLVFNIKDKSGEVSAKVWNDADKFYKILKKGRIFDIEGKINKYKGTSQLIVSSIEPSNTIDYTNFLPTSKRNPDKMWLELVEILDKNIDDIQMTKVWERYKNNEKFISVFKMCPGGKGPVHHAYISGLLEHTLDVVKICESFTTIYPIDPSTICLGAFLHDHGKMSSYTYKMDIEMTDLGRLHSHINLGYTYFVKILEKIDISNENKKYIQKIIGHLILSHHGTLEQGSAVIPMTPEAILLAKADITDSELNQCLIYKEKTIEGNWSSYDNLKNKFYYKDSFK